MRRVSADDDPPTVPERRERNGTNPRPVPVARTYACCADAPDDALRHGTAPGGPGMSDDSGLSINGPESLRGALLMVLVGLAIAGYGGYDYVQQSDAVRDAVEVNATVEAVGVETVSARRGVDHKPTVRFSYEYDGRTYESTSVFPATISPNYDTESAARSVVAEYEVGETVTAYVVPDRPGDAFLKNKTTNTPLLAAGFGVVFVLAGGWFALKRL